MGNVQENIFLYYLQGFSSTGGYKTIKSQIFRFSLGVVMAVKVVVLGGLK